MLMGISVTKKLLHRWLIEDNNQCNYCGAIETVAHVVAECEIANETFNNLQIMYELYGNTLLLTKENIILVNTNDKAQAVIIIILKEMFTLNHLTGTNCDHRLQVKF